MRELNWATLGCGAIAHQLAESMKKQNRTLYGVANRTYDHAVDFANQYGVGKVYDRIDDLFEDDSVDVIYISTPHNTHLPFLMKALQSGKHVLCEKPLR